jgi:hypothetical protein
MTYSNAVVRGQAHGQGEIAMRKIFKALILTAILFASACSLCAQTVNPPKVEQKIMLVPGNKDFTKTGLTIGPGDRVTITATGKVYFCDGAAASEAGPDGWPRATFSNTWVDDYNFCADPIETVGHAALIADVNNDRFAIGAKKTFSGKNGLLYLGINDCSLTGQFYNTGQFSVVIKVERNAIPFQKQ